MLYIKQGYLNISITMDENSKCLHHQKGLIQTISHKRENYHSNNRQQCHSEYGGPFHF